MLWYVIAMAVFALFLIHPQLLWHLFCHRKRRKGQRPSTTYMVLCRVIAILALLTTGVLFYIQLVG